MDNERRLLFENAPKVTSGGGISKRDVSTGNNRRYKRIMWMRRRHGIPLIDEVSESGLHLLGIPLSVGSSVTVENLVWTVETTL